MGKYYAVKNGRTQGIFNNWDDCKQQVNGYSGAQFKSFPTREAAEAYAGGGGSSGGYSGGGYSGGYSGGGGYYSSSPRQTSSTPRTSNNKTSSSSRGSYRSTSNTSTNSRGSYRSNNTPQSSSSSSSSYDVTYTTPSYTASAPSSSRASNTSAGKKTTVYTDGSSLGNGKRGAKAGWASYWGPNDPRNTSGPVLTGEQTNNRGELIAIHETLKSIDSDAKSGKASSSGYKVMADSHYARDSLSKWTDNWVAKGWKTSTGGDVKNRDIIEPAHNLLTDLRQRGVSVDIDYVPAHSGHAGNEAADLMARTAAEKSS